MSISTIPTDLLEEIIQFLPSFELHQVIPKVCREWKSLQRGEPKSCDGFHEKLWDFECCHCPTKQKIMSLLQTLNQTQGPRSDKVFQRSSQLIRVARALFGPQHKLAYKPEDPFQRGFVRGRPSGLLCYAAPYVLLVSAATDRTRTGSEDEMEAKLLRALTYTLMIQGRSPELKDWIWIGQHIMHLLPGRPKFLDSGVKTPRDPWLAAEKQLKKPEQEVAKC